MQNGCPETLIFIRKSLPERYCFCENVWLHHLMNDSILLAKIMHITFFESVINFLSDRFYRIFETSSAQEACHVPMSGGSQQI